MTPDEWDRQIRALFWETWATSRVPLLVVRPWPHCSRSRQRYASPSTRGSGKTPGSQPMSGR